MSQKKIKDYNLCMHNKEFLLQINIYSQTCLRDLFCYLVGFWFKKYIIYHLRPTRYFQQIIKLLLTRNQRIARLMSGSCHLDRASNDEFSVECLFWFFQSTWISDLKVVQITKNDLFWVKKDNNNKNLTFRTNFNIRRTIQMTWTRQKI